MKNLVYMLIFAVSLVSVGMNAQAQGKKKAKPAPEQTREEKPKHRKQSVNEAISGQGYGVAGCGLGSIAFGPKPGMVQIVAATLNGIGGQTFAITSGTSNCDIPEMGQQAAVFIEVNKEVVTREAARGDGESLEGLAKILNCSDSAAFGQSLKKNFETIFDNESNTYETTRRILNTIKTDETLNKSCAVVS